MNTYEIEYNYDYLEIYFDSHHDNNIRSSFPTLFELLDIYREKYFKFNNKIENFELTKKIFDLLYSKVRKTAFKFFYNGKFRSAANIYKKFELIIMYSNINKIIKYISYIEYEYNLSFLLYHSNEEFEAINRCDSITSEYLVKNSKINNYNRIILEEGKSKSDKTDYDYYFEYMILFSKLAQLICSKVGMNDIIGNFYFRQKLFEEQLLYRFIKLPYVYNMVTERFYVNFGESVQHVVSDEKYNAKGIRKWKINLNRLSRAILYSFFRITTGFGEKPFNLLKTSLLLVIIWAIIYSYVETSSICNFSNYFYQSFFIFTTFGLIDNIIQLNSSSMLWISLEIAIGIIFINGFIVILAKKLIR